MTDSTPSPGTPPIDVDEVARLVAAIERDLEHVQAGRADLQALRDEVRALGALLDTSAADHAMGEGLQQVHRRLTDIAVEDGFKAADYLARIGRMLAL